MQDHGRYEEGGLRASIELMLRGPSLAMCQERVERVLECAATGNKVVYTAGPDGRTFEDSDLLLGRVMGWERLAVGGERGGRCRGVCWAVRGEEERRRHHRAPSLWRCLCNGGAIQADARLRARGDGSLHF